MAGLAGLQNLPIFRSSKSNWPSCTLQDHCTFEQWPGKKHPIPSAHSHIGDERLGGWTASFENPSWQGWMMGDIKGFPAVIFRKTSLQRLLFNILPIAQVESSYKSMGMLSIYHHRESSWSWATLTCDRCFWYGNNIETNPVVPVSISVCSSVVGPVLDLQVILITWYGR